MANRFLKVITIIVAITVLGDLTGRTAAAEDSLLSVEEVNQLLTGNTEIWTEGAGYYGHGGKLLVLWKGKSSKGTWKVINRNSRGILCYKVSGKDQYCHQSYKRSGDEIILQWKLKDSRTVEYLKGNQIDSLKSGMSVLQIARRQEEEEAARRRAQKEAEEEAARQLAKQKAEEELEGATESYRNYMIPRFGMSYLTTHLREVL